MNFIQYCLDPYSCPHLFFRKLWKFSTTKQLLEAIYKASLSPDEYNISMNSQDSCDGGAMEGINVSRKLMTILNFSSSVLVPRGENVNVDVVERYIRDFIGLPRTNAYHTQLVKYEARSEVTMYLLKLIYQRHLQKRLSGIRKKYAA